MLCLSCPVAVQELRLETSRLQSEAQHRQQIAQEHESLKRQHEQLARAQHDSGSARVHELERQVKALTDQRTYLHREKADLEDQCLALRKENSQYESRIFDLRQKNQSQVQSYGDVHSLHAAEIESYSNKNRDLTFQLNANRKSIEEVCRMLCRFQICVRCILSRNPPVTHVVMSVQLPTCMCRALRALILSVCLPQSVQLTSITGSQDGVIHKLRYACNKWLVWNLNLGSVYIFVRVCVCLCVCSASLTPSLAD